LRAQRLHIWSLVKKKTEKLTWKAVGPNAHYLCLEPVSVMMFGGIS
jgi:hypothetical protein